MPLLPAAIGEQEFNCFHAYPLPYPCRKVLLAENASTECFSSNKTILSGLLVCLFSFWVSAFTKRPYCTIHDRAKLNLQGVPTTAIKALVSDSPDRRQHFSFVTML